MGSAYDWMGFIPLKHLDTGNCWLFTKEEINDREEQRKCFMANFGKEESPLLQNLVEVEIKKKNEEERSAVSQSPVWIQ